MDSKKKRNETLPQQAQKQEFKDLPVPEFKDFPKPVFKDFPELKDYMDKRFESLESLISQQKEVFNIDEAAEFLGLSKSYLYRLTSRGMIPHTKPLGKIIRFDRAELENWMRRNKVGSE